MCRVFALAVLCVLGPLLPAADKNPPQKTVIPFDFESKFDDGRYGRTLGDMFWQKIQRQGGFVLPESMQDVRDWCQRTKLLPSPDTTLEKMKEIVRKEQGGDIGIWGKIERVPGNDTDVYDLWITIADFSAEPVKVIFEKKMRTKTVSEIPHVHVKEALDRLYDRKAPEVVAADPDIATRWEKGPNLVKGDFAKADKGPAGWDPLPKYVTWVAEDSRSKKRIIRFTLNEDVAGSSGVLFYSDYFPVEAGATYRFQCRWRTTGSAAKVFVKCYDEIPGPYAEKPGVASGTQRREVYRSQQNLTGDANVWNTHTEDFTPKHAKYTPHWGRVMLYAYWPAGTVDWDDVIVKQIVSPPPGKGDKEPSKANK
jgi:hypothetical protein